MYISGGQLAFSDFLDVMHAHSQVEKLPTEVLAAFKAADPRRTGLVSAKDLRHILLNWGERLSVKEGK
jgi:Ca2+-binding EF-hand superfamily protein